MQITKYHIGRLSKIFLILASVYSAALLSSCKAFHGTFADQHVSIGNEGGISRNKESKSSVLAVIKVSVQSSINDGDLIGFRIEPNINNRAGQGKVFIRNNPTTAINQIAKEYAESEGFKIAISGSYDKDLQLKLMYLDYRTKGGGLSVGLICNVAIKSTLYNNHGKILHEKWYFISKEFDRYQYNKTEVTTNNINKTLDEIIGNIFADNVMLTQLKAR